MSTSTLYRLGKNWVALVSDDGESVTLQYHAQVLSRAGQVYDLTEQQPPKDMEPVHLFVRTFLMDHKGSMWMDNQGLSAGGMIADPFEVVSSAHKAFAGVVDAWQVQKGGDGRL